MAAASLVSHPPVQLGNLLLWNLMHHLPVDSWRVLPKPPPLPRADVRPGGWLKPYAHRNPFTRVEGGFFKGSKHMAGTCLSNEGRRSLGGVWALGIHVCECECVPFSICSTGTWHSLLVLDLLSMGRKYLMPLFWLQRPQETHMWGLRCSLTKPRTRNTSGSPASLVN